MDWHALVRDRLAGRPGATAAVVEEVAQHLADLYDESRREGASHEDALAAAGRVLDDEGERLAAEVVRAARTPAAAVRAWRSAPEPPLGEHLKGWRRMLSDFVRDASYALRLLARSPGFTAAAVLTLSLGIGVTTAAFSVVNATLFARLPVAHVDRLVYLGGDAATLSYPAYADFRDRNDVFDGLAAWGGIAASVNAENETDTVIGAIVTGNFFEVLGVTAALGRVLTEADDRQVGAHAVAVISDALWRRRFGGRDDIVGHRIVLNGQPFEIVGVTPPAFEGAQQGSRRDLYVPMAMQPLMRPPRAGYSGEMNPDLLNVRTNQWLFTVGRLRDGVTQTQAHASLDALVAALESRPPTASGSAPRLQLHAVAEGPPGRREGLTPAAALLAAVVAVVLLIASANVANLLLSRGLARRREVAVRLAVGGTRARLFRQFITESLVLAGAGGLLGIGIAAGIARAMTVWPPPAGAIPLPIEFALDQRVLIFSVTLSALTGLLFGVLPAWQAARPDVVTVLKDEPGGVRVAFRRVTLKNALVVVQVALSLALLVGSGLLVRSLLASQRIDAGYAVDHIVTLDLPINLLRYTTAQGREFYRLAVERAAALPGAQAAAVSRTLVLGGPGRRQSLLIEGRQGDGAAFSSEGGGFNAPARTSTLTNVVDPGYLSTMGVALREGRNLGFEDGPDAPLVVLVNEEFARRHFDGASPIGKRIGVNGPKGPLRTIVGLVADGKYESIHESPQTMVYLPLAQNHETGMTLHVRAATSAASIVPALRRSIQQLDPNLPLGAARPVSQTLSTSLYAARTGALLVSGLGLLALALASIGLYGVLAFVVSSRTREIGIRAALGASSSALFRMVVVEGLALVGAGIVLGLAVAAAASGLLRRFLVGVDAADAATYAGVVMLLILVAAAVCALPARRATAIEPIEALRRG
jgi:predicted permease